MTNRTCLNCGWVHFGVTRQNAEEAVASFNRFYDSAPQETQAMYGNKCATMESYTHCFRCGGPYTQFRDTQDGDCPDGCTLQPIVV